MEKTEIEKEIEQVSSSVRRRCIKEDVSNLILENKAMETGRWVLRMDYESEYLLSEECTFGDYGENIRAAVIIEGVRHVFPTFLGFIVEWGAKKLELAPL